MPEANCTLDRLPPPPPGKSGWPWTKETPRIDNRPWPKITVVTPSYNQGRYLEQTIRSVLLQGYPNLEYFVMDGGSTDESVAIIKKYEPWLAGWISEKDRGQTDAIRKGWERATGDVMAWINSDDWYQLGALQAVARAFLANPAATWVGGAVDDVTTDGNLLKHRPAVSASLTECLGRHTSGYHQPGMFWSRDLIRRAGPLDLKSHYSFDYDLWIRFHLAGATMIAIPESVAFFRRHKASKTMSRLERFLEEDWMVFNRYTARVSVPERKQAARWLREYEADNLLDITYGLMLRGHRCQALGYVLRRFRLWPLIKPPKALAGLLYRLIITGRVPV